jgi:feruloyl esterase
MGGREAMMVTQRLGQYYDGVVVGDPGFRLPLNAVQVSANVKALAQLPTRWAWSRALALRS